jgi:hypothetical protein
MWVDYFQLHHFHRDQLQHRQNLRDFLEMQKKEMNLLHRLQLKLLMKKLNLHLLLHVSYLLDRHLRLQLLQE